MMACVRFHHRRSRAPAVKQHAVGLGKGNHAAAAGSVGPVERDGVPMPSAPPSAESSHASVGGMKTVSVTVVLFVT